MSVHGQNLGRGGVALTFGGVAIRAKSGAGQALGVFFVGLLALVMIGMDSCSSKPNVAPSEGATLFVQRCSSCHSPNNDMRAPAPAALHLMSQRFILAALDSGRMKFEAKGLSKTQRHAIAAYLAAPDSPIVAFAGNCSRDLDPPGHAPAWHGWGVNPSNNRYQNAIESGLSAESVGSLKLKWAFGFPGAAATFGQPTSYGGRVFVGSEDGTVYTLDAATGCLWWMYKASATVKTAISVSGDGEAAYFGDTNGNVYALRVADGSVMWRVHPEAHEAARVTGSPLLLGKRLYVPVSSGEEGASANPMYPCCTFRGSVVALDTSTGRTIWRSYTIDDAPKPTRKGPSGVQYYGPSGAAVWSSPTADLKAQVLYVATGNNYSDPSTDSSDAVIAYDLRTGKRLWSQQFTPKDVWNSGCVAEKKDSCPAPHGDDYDFGAPPILTALPNGRRMLLAAQKSGIIYALDPDDKGRLLWKVRIGKGGPLGGVEWGGATDGRYSYFPLSDFDFDNPNVGGGVFAVDLVKRKVVWHIDPAKPTCAGQYGCSPAQMAPPTLIPGVLFVGSLDGHLRAYEAKNGNLIWDFDTAQAFKTANGIPAHGGSLNGAGPAIAGGMMFVNSGYTNAMPGNVLLAFSAEKGDPQTTPTPLATSSMQIQNHR